MLTAQMDKGTSLQNQVGNVNREIEVLRKNQKEMLQIKNTIKEMMNIFDRLIIRLHLAEERISELENISIETFKTENQTGKRLRKKPEQTIQEL